MEKKVLDVKAMVLLTAKKISFTENLVQIPIKISTGILKKVSHKRELLSVDQSINPKNWLFCYSCLKKIVFEKMQHEKTQ